MLIELITFFRPAGLFHYYFNRHFVELPSSLTEIQEIGIILLFYVQPIFENPQSYIFFFKEIGFFLEKSNNKIK